MKFLFTSLLLLAAAAHGLDLTRKNNVAVYWGQGLHEESLEAYCFTNASSYDIIFLAFLDKFPTSGSHAYSTLSLGGHCWTEFPQRPGLLHCPDVAAQISRCQAAGKTLLLSIGGGVGAYALSSEQAAKSFAKELWDTYFGGSSAYRPFDAAVLDGVDLDIELGSPAHYAEFVNELRRLSDASGSKRRLFVSGAPQCPFSDQFLGPDGKTWNGHLLNGSALTWSHFDFVATQFYNNEACNAGTQGFRTGSWSFGVWNTWAEKAGVRVLMGNLADASEGTGSTTIPQLKSDLTFASQYSQFSGCMFWNAALASSTGKGPEISKWLKATFPNQFSTMGPCLPCGVRTAQAIPSESSSTTAWPPPKTLLMPTSTRKSFPLHLLTGSPCR